MAAFNKFSKFSMKQAAAIMECSKEAVGYIKDSGVNAKDGAVRFSKEVFFKYEETYYKWEDYKEANRRVKMLWNTTCISTSTLLAAGSWLQGEKHKELLEKHKKMVEKQLVFLKETIELSEKNTEQLESKIEGKLKELGDKIERLKKERHTHLVQQPNPLTKLIAARDDMRFQQARMDARRRDLGVASNGSRLA